MAKIEQNIERSKKEEQHKSKSLESNLEEVKSEFSNLGNIPIPIITIREKNPGKNPSNDFMET